MSAIAISLLTFTLLFNIGAINANTILCDSHSCQNQPQQCVQDEDCHIRCNGINACQSATVLCPTDHRCIVSCHGNFACDKAIINATSSSWFELNGCATGNLWTCSGITIYFPRLDDNGNARAFLHGSNQLNGRSQPLQFYAENGWRDIDTSGYSGTFAYFDGTMHCTADYQTTCAFNDADWSCQSTHSLCNHLAASSSVSSSSELLQIVATKAKLKSSDILLIIVIILVVCVCWFGCILTYYVQKAAKLKKEAVHKRHVKMKHMILTPMREEDECNTFDVESIDFLEKQITTSREGDIQTHERTTKPSKHTMETIATYPLHPVEHDTPNRLPFINYSCVESYHHEPLSMEHEGVKSENERTNLNGLRLEPMNINYSIQEQRQHHHHHHPLNTSVTVTPDMEDDDDDTIAINTILTQQNNVHTSSEDDCVTPSASKDTTNSKNNGACHVSSAMYLYNSDMAIPECSENPQHINIPTTPQMHTTVRSPTPTLSETDCPGLSAQMLGPATPKLPASSCASNSTSVSTQSDMTYMTASTFGGVMDDPFSCGTSTIRSGRSSSSCTESSCGASSNNNSPKPLDLKIHIYDESIASYHHSNTKKKSADTLSESMETPICSNALSLSYSNSTKSLNTDMVEEEEEFSVDNNHSWMDRGRHHNDNDGYHTMDNMDRNECDMLRMMMTPEDDDTSSWVSGDTDDDDNHRLHVSGHNESATKQTLTLNTPRTQDTCVTSTEYDSSTSSMLDELEDDHVPFNREKTEDEEESIDFGIQ